MTRLRFVHAADLHLDSPFRGIRAEAPPHVADTLHRATFDAYENIVSLCLRERVDALLVAGDIYDGADRSLRAQLRFIDGLNRLDAAGIRTFVCHGNHDPLDGWEARLDLPPGCVRFGREVSREPVFPDEPQRAAVYGVSYPTREIRESLVPLFDSALSTLSAGFNIGLLHANVGGHPDHDPYAPCSVADLAGTGLDYWALGHVHTRQVLRDERPTVVYPGNPQGRNPRETGERGVYLAEVNDQGQLNLSFRPVDVVRWEFMEVDITGLETEQELLDAIDHSFASCATASGGRPVVIRLSLTGRGSLNRWIRATGTADQLQEQINDQYAHESHWLWCERIQVTTGSPVDREQAARREDFTGDLARLGASLREDPGGLVELRDSLRTLYVSSNAAPYLRTHLPSNEELLELLAAAEEECLSSLVREEDEE